jgi:5'-hydroxyaverantin dehydrogenase
MSRKMKAKSLPRGWAAKAFSEIPVSGTGRFFSNDPANLQRRRSVQFVKTDVRSFEEQNAAFKAAIAFSKTASIDVVIACAGLNGNSILNWLNRTEQLSESEEPSPPNTTVIDVNLTGVFYTTHLALHYFRRTAKSAPLVQSKQVIFVSSLAGYSSLPHTMDYQGTKYGVRGFFRSIRGSSRVLGESGARFRANLIAPTFILTNMTAMLEQQLAAVGIKMGTVDDCVDVMLRIASDEEVDGRAIAVAPEKMSFDLCDDFDGLDAGKELIAKLESGIFGTGFAALGNVNSNRKTAG